MDYIIVGAGLIFMILGLVGSFVPVIPGPPLSFISILLLDFSSKDVFSTVFLLVFFLFVLIISILDYVLPLMGAKLFGVSKYGIWGSAIGILIGIIFFPPMGMILGGIIGAVLGELYLGKENSDAMKAGLITFLLNLFMMVSKFILSAIMAFYFIYEAYNLF